MVWQINVRECAMHWRQSEQVLNILQAWSGSLNVWKIVMCYACVKLQYKKYKFSAERKYFLQVLCGSE